MSKASIIIAFYNRIDFLKLVIAGLENQTEKEFEIIIADDGSGQVIVDQIKNLMGNFNGEIKHVWHRKIGFRKNKILNEAIRVSNSNYLIFIDGDCIPHNEFIKEHLFNSAKKIALTGRRVNLSEKVTSLLTPEKIRNQFFNNNFLHLIYDGIFGNSSYVEKGLYVKNVFLRKLMNNKKRGLIGCNFSLYKQDMLDINGFDERYQTPSIGEDTDVEYRLELNGVKIKLVNNIAVQYHLYHRLQERSPKNLLLFNEVKKQQVAFTQFGIQRDNTHKK
jgi:glycosyltransferase involved in cell wall biosynthesis